MTKKKRTTEYDSPWKNIIESFFEDFMRFFFLAVHEQIDWTRNYEFLEQELQKVVREAVTQNRRVDKLVKVWRKNGKEALLYIHIEVQSQYDSDFPERIFIYHYRLYDRYGSRVTSLAILGDGQKYWRPRSYHYESMGAELSFCFPMVKLLDYQEKWDELENSRNPFSIVVRAHLKALETQKSPQQRLDWKMTLYKALYEESYSDKEIMGLLVFLDWLLILPDELTRQFNEFVEQYEEANKMDYVTTWERNGIEKGILQNSRQNVADILDTRFQQVPKTLVETIQAVDDTSLLSKLFKEAILVESLENFEQRIKEYGLSNDDHKKPH
jgi:hypothetical protein